MQCIIFTPAILYSRKEPSVPIGLETVDFKSHLDVMVKKKHHSFCREWNSDCPIRSQSLMTVLCNSALCREYLTVFKLTKKSLAFMSPERLLHQI
jgi:hypothetical protein